MARVNDAPSAGTRTGNWPSQVDAQRLLDAPDPFTHKGVRDPVMLAVLLGRGLRRSEITAFSLAYVAMMRICPGRAARRTRADVEAEMPTCAVTINSAC